MGEAFIYIRGGLTLIGENVPEKKIDFPVRKDFHCKNQVILRYKESELHTDSDKEIFIPQCVGEEFICSYFWPNSEKAVLGSVVTFVKPDLSGNVHVCDRKEDHERPC